MQVVYSLSNTKDNLINVESTSINIQISVYNL